MTLNGSFGTDVQITDEPAQPAVVPDRAAHPADPGELGPAWWPGDAGGQ